MTVILREITKNDISIINKWRSDPELIENFISPFRYINIEADEEWFESYQKDRRNNVRCAICLKDTKRIIGVVYLLSIDWVHRNAEFAISISEKKHQDKGYGTAATTKILEHGFYDLNLHRIYLRVLEENINAISFYKKLGFKTEGVLREAAFKRGKYKNVLLMSIIDYEFIRKQER